MKVYLYLNKERHEEQDAWDRYSCSRADRDKPKGKRPSGNVHATTALLPRQRNIRRKRWNPPRR